MSKGNHDGIDQVLTELGYGPNLTAGKHARQARGPRPRATQQAQPDPRTAGLTAEERAIDAAFNRPATESDDLADLTPSDRELLEKWRATSPAILDDDDAQSSSGGVTLSPADEALYAKLFGGR